MHKKKIRAHFHGMLHPSACHKNQAMHGFASSSLAGFLLGRHHYYPVREEYEKTIGRFSKHYKGQKHEASVLR